MRLIIYRKRYNISLQLYYTTLGFDKDMINYFFIKSVGDSQESHRPAKANGKDFKHLQRMLIL